MSRPPDLLPLSYDDPTKRSSGPFTRTYFLLRRRPYRVLLLILLALLALYFHTTLGTLRRDLIYLIRPIWDTPEAPFQIIPHYAPPVTGKPAWCALHGWQPRAPGSRPIIVDAVMISTELDMLEIRMREYAPFVTVFIVVEADLTLSGKPKPLWLKGDLERFERIANEHNAQLVYRQVTGLETDLPRGSFVNEIKQRVEISSILSDMRRSGHLPPDSLIIQSDVDEIISRQTLDLLTSCHGYPADLHLNVKNYRYGFSFPLNDGGYWRPRVVTVQEGDDFEVGYHHQRASDWMLADAGWHCTFCFSTLDEMRAKMMGYSHNDRVRSTRLLEERVLRDKVCKGEDPFGMWPVSGSSVTLARKLVVPLLSPNTDSFRLLFPSIASSQCAIQSLSYVAGQQPVHQEAISPLFSHSRGVAP